MSHISGQGTQFTWGTTEFLITSVQVNAASGGEIDITSMSSEVVSDSYNSNRKLIVQDFDTCFSSKYGTEVSVEFYAGTTLSASSPLELVSSKRTLVLKFPATEEGQGVGISITKTAILTQMTIGVSTAEFVRGSATFKMTGS